MKYWIIRIPEPRPFGETSLRAIVRAICSADPVNVRVGGCVESVVTRLTQRFEARFFVMASEPGRSGVAQSRLGLADGSGRCAPSSTSACDSASRQVLNKPISRESRYRFEGPRLFEQMGRVGHNLKFLGTLEAGKRPPVQLDHDVIATADDQQSRRTHGVEGIFSQIGATAT